MLCELTNLPWAERNVNEEGSTFKGLLSLECYRTVRITPTHPVQ